MAEKLTGTQRKYLRGLAHGRKPVVLIGQKGLEDAVLLALDEALDTHELIKVKFNECKEKEEKKAVIELIASKTKAALCGQVGHVAIFFRQHKNPEKRKITLPKP